MIKAKVLIEQEVKKNSTFDPNLSELEVNSAYIKQFSAYELQSFVFAGIYDPDLIRIGFPRKLRKLLGSKVKYFSFLTLMFSFF